MDAVLISKIKSGDEAVFAEAYYTYQNKIYYFFLRKVRSAALCDELVQETFIKLWNYRGSLNETLPLSTQIFRIATTTMIDVLRKEARKRVVFVPLENAESIPEAATGNELVKEKISYLQNLICNLPPMRRRILEYRLDGLSNQEIADHLYISRKTVENHINKAFSEIKNKANLPIFLFVALQGIIS